MEDFKSTYRRPGARGRARSSIELEPFPCRGHDAHRPIDPALARRSGSSAPGVLQPAGAGGAS
jgi:hypothetical protein